MNEKRMYELDKKVLKNLLDIMREQYNLYNDDDKEIIDAIHMLKEELEYNVEDIDEEDID